MSWLKGEYLHNVMHMEKDALTRRIQVCCLGGSGMMFYVIRDRIGARPDVRSINRNVLERSLRGHVQ